jgi:hypothetical protein
MDPHFRHKNFTAIELTKFKAHLTLTNKYNTKAQAVQQCLQPYETLIQYTNDL